MLTREMTVTRRSSKAASSECLHDVELTVMKGESRFGTVRFIHRLPFRCRVHREHSDKARDEGASDDHRGTQKGEAAVLVSTAEQFVLPH